MHSLNTFPWGRCPLFAEPSIFGKSKLYWDEWKKQWDTRLGEWAVQTAQEQEPISGEPISNTKPRIDLDENEEIDIGFLQRKASELERKRTASEITASRLALLNLNKTITEHAENRDDSPPTRAKEHPQRRVSLRIPETVSTSRERHRAKNLIQDVSRNDATLSIDRLKLDKTLPKDKKNDEMQESSEIAAVKLHRTARERRRERQRRSMSI
ncbi:hypothetical protein ACFW04_010673 [Cataglyphis niger]